MKNPLAIDEMRLDREWVDQPKLMAEWTEKAANCQFDYDTAKSNLSLTEAELSHDVRSDPDSYGVTKVINESVAVAVKTDPKYRAAVANVTKSRHDLALANAMVTALEHRKRALTMLVELWIRDYYAKPTEPTDQQKAAIRGRARRRREESGETGGD